MIVKIEKVQISLVLNAKTWNVWILLFERFWLIVETLLDIEQKLTWQMLKNRRCWWQLSADRTHYAIGWNYRKNLSHRNNWLRVVFVWVLGFEKEKINKNNNNNKGNN